MKRILNRHIKNVHDKGKIHRCDQCEKCFTRASGLKEHIKGVHEKLKDNVCEDCGMAFSAHSNLQKHIKNVHQLRRNHRCDFCGKEFYLSRDVLSLRQKNKNKIKMQNRPFKRALNTKFFQLF